MIKIAVLGCGRIGQMHARNVSNHPDTSLAAVYDTNKEFGERIANELNVPLINDDKKIFEDNNIDAILIASPTATHIEFIEKSVASNKPVYCEKPIDLNISKVNECAKRLQGNTVPIHLGFNRRFDPGHVATRDAMIAGEIGDLHQVIITSRDPGLPSMEYYKEAGGLLRDMTIHDFDIARFMLQEDPVKVFAIANALEEPKLKSELNDFDTVMVIMETKSGKQCHINNSRSSKYGYDQRIELVGNKGMVLSDNKKINNVKKYSANGENTSTVEHFFLERYHDAFMNGLTSFAACIKNKTMPDVGFEDGRKALLLAEAAYESLKNHQMVNVNYD